MKNRPSSTGCTGRALRRWLAVAVLGCSSSEPPLTDQAPALPGVVDPSVAPPGGADPTTYGSPGADPVSVPVESDGPGATETNFFTPPCGKDGDCGDGRRCIGGVRMAAVAGAADGGADAGAPPDGGVALGRCESADGG